jgi:ABC-2 type transport system permease protein
MIPDIYAVLRNEWRGFFRYGESKRSGWVRWGALGFLGVIIARALGPEFGASWTTVLAVAFIAVIFIPAVVADSFAGERERHTLETLLASRISDAALLLGKYAANLLYGWVAALGMMALGVGVAYLRYGGTDAFQVRPAILAAAAVIGFLGAGAITGVGVLVSLRAPTVRRATETLTIILIGLTLIPAILTELPLPAWVEALADAVPPLPPGGPGIREFFLTTTLLLALNTALLALTLSRFRRARLII